MKRLLDKIYWLFGFVFGYLWYLSGIKREKLVDMIEKAKKALTPTLSPKKPGSMFGLLETPFEQE